MNCFVSGKARPQLLSVAGLPGLAYVLAFVTTREGEMKRYQICAQALTMGLPLVYTLSDSPKEAYQLAQKLAAAGARQVEIRDAEADKFYDLKSFASAHRLA